MRFHLLRVALVATLTIGVFASTLGLAQTATAYSFGPWTTRWYTASAAECQKANALAKQFIGPIQYYGHGCDYPVRVRKAAINTSSWVDYVVQIENTAPVWNVWGMRMEVQVHYNGSVAKYDPASKWCNDYSFIIAVTPVACDVYNSNTSDMLVRMAYNASFAVQGGIFSVQRGAEIHVHGNGPDTTAKKWP